MYIINLIHEKIQILYKKNKINFLSKKTDQAIITAWIRKILVKAKYIYAYLSFSDKKVISHS